MSSTADNFDRAFRLHQQGRLREALDVYDSILAAHPTHAPTLHYSGLILHQSGRPAAGLQRVERSVALDPQSADAWSNLALLYQAAGRAHDALSALAEATRRAPRDGAVWENYAAHLLDAGHLDQAARAARHATTLNARSASAWYNLALALHRQRQLADALQAIARARALAPDAAPLAGLQAAIEHARGRPEAARAVLESALARKPEPALRFQLATLFEHTGDLASAAAGYETLLDADLQGAALSQLLFLRKRLADWRDLDALRARFRAGIAAKLPLLSPFCLLSDPSSRAEQRRCADTWTSALMSDPPPHVTPSDARAASGAAQGVGTDRLPGAQPLIGALGAAVHRAGESGDRLTIGYLSADFHMHATALLIAGLFERHDRKRYHVIAYSTGADDESPLRKRIENAAESFVHAHGWSAEQLTARIRADAVDILVDLKGHTENARMDVLARRPAPIQVSYLGYPGTTGAPFIDYLVGDAIVTPLAHAADYTETIVQLPGCYQVNDRQRRIAAPPSREALGLSADALVLCCFNQTYKIGPEVLDAWSVVLKRLDNSVLWLLARSPEDPAIANLRQEVTRRGVPRERLVFACARPNDEYLGLYAHAQLCLDTWPYNGHTTTSDALWAGCPVITTLGETFAGRVAASILTAVGLPELVARDPAQYVEMACTLAADAAGSAKLRLYLEDAGRKSLLFDAGVAARAMERAFEAMIEQRSAGRREAITLA